MSWNQLFWMDIKTQDIDRTKQFYRTFFDWHYKEETIFNRVQTKIYVGENEIGGLTDLYSPVFPKGVSPHVSSYVLVENVDQMAEKVVKLGGKLILEPFTVGALGRMTTIQDPTGAVLSLWKTGEFQGMNTVATREGVPNRLELLTTDLALAGTFYSELFHWKMEATNEGSYLNIRLDSRKQYLGGMSEISRKQMETQWIIGFIVKDIDEKLAMAQSLGAKLVANLQHISEVGRRIILTCPDGTVCAVMEHRMDE
jgi:predicted enzyme related to lactoylglutathione lyase